MPANFSTQGTELMHIVASKEPSFIRGVNGQNLFAIRIGAIQHFVISGIHPAYLLFIELDVFARMRLINNVIYYFIFDFQRTAAT